MSIKEQLIGTWRLISQHTEYPDGSIEVTRGEKPDGILMYDAQGNMSVHLLRSTEPTMQHTDLTSFETAMDQYHGYFGTYEVVEEECVVYHNVVGSGFPPYVGTRQRREFKLDGDVLNLSSRATTAGDDTARHLVWHRITGKYSD